MIEPVMGTLINYTCLTMLVTVFATLMMGVAIFFLNIKGR